MSIQSEINRIKAAVSALAASITNKGVTVPDGTKLDGMAALVDSIQSGGGSSLKITDASYLFYLGARMDAFDDFMSILGKVTDVSYMFSGNKKITSFNLSEIDMSECKNLTNMFYNSSVKSVDFGGADTHSVTSDSYISMFSSGYITEIIGYGFPGIQPTSWFWNSPFPQGVASTGTKGKLSRLTFRQDLPTGEYAISGSFAISYNSFTRESLVEMFNTLPDVNPLLDAYGAKKINIEGNDGASGLTYADRAIAISKGWTLIE